MMREAVDEDFEDVLGEIVSDLLAEPHRADDVEKRESPATVG